MRHTPKQAHRFSVSFDGLGFGQEGHHLVLWSNVESVERPHFTRDEHGRRVHSPFKVVLRDDIENIVAQNVMHQYRIGGEFSVEIAMFDAKAQVVEQIKVERCRLARVEHSPLQYGSPEPSTITLLIEPQEVQHVTFERMTVTIKDGKPVLNRFLPHDGA